MHIRVLGPLEVETDAGPVALRRGRQRRLLLALLLRSGERLATDELIEHLWAEGETPRNAANALQILVFHLRKALDGSSARIDTLDGGYRLDVEASTVDAFRFERAVEGLATIEDAEERLATVDDALALWRGAPYAEANYDEIAQGEIARLHELRHLAVESRIDALLHLGRHAVAVGELQRLVVEQPLRERFHEQLIVALYRSGRQADALRAYDSAREVLLDELGLDPGPALRAVAQAVLEQDPMLDPVARTHASARSAPSTPVDEPTTPTPLVGAGVPVRLTTLVGRDGAVVALAASVDRHRLVTVTGPGGVGKTRLALAVAGVRSEPVWWVDLAAVGPDGLVDAVAAAIGATTKPDDRGSGIAAHLAATEGLLVLDTCEHVADRVAPLVEHLLGACAGLRVLATSRQPLRVGAEALWPVELLAVPPLGADAPIDLTTAAASPAVQLFVERASDARPGFTLTDDNAATIVRICHVLDGLPLAIELAAGHADLLSPDKILTLLDDCLGLLDRGTGGRHDALRSTIASSYDRLDPDEARFLERLGTFAGAFSLEAAAVVAGEDLGAEDVQLVLGLARQSLVTATGDDHFRLLDSVRAFALERLAARGEAEVRSTRERHLRWCLQFAAEADRHLRGPDADGWRAELRAQLPEMRHALTQSLTGDPSPLGVRLAVRLCWFWLVEGLFAEATHWLEHAERVVEPETTEHAHVLVGRGILLAALGDLEASARRCEHGARIYERHGRDDRLAHALLYAGVARWGLGDLDDAAWIHDRAIALFRDGGNDWGHSFCLTLRARTGMDLGEDAGVRLDAALALAHRAGDGQLVSLALQQQSRAAAVSEDWSRAEALAADALARSEAIGHSEGVVASTILLGRARLSQGATAEAIGMLDRAREVAEEIRHPGAAADALEGLAEAALASADPVCAAERLAAADAIRADHRLPRPPSTERSVDRLRTRISGGSRTVLGPA